MVGASIEPLLCGRSQIDAILRIGANARAMRIEFDVSIVPMAPILAAVRIRIACDEYHDRTGRRRVYVNRTTVINRLDRYCGFVVPPSGERIPGVARLPGAAVPAAAGRTNAEAGTTNAQTGRTNEGARNTRSPAVGGRSACNDYDELGARTVGDGQSPAVIPAKRASTNSSALNSTRS